MYRIEYLTGSSNSVSRREGKGREGEMERKIKGETWREDG